ncbi:hypothetical protein [Aliidongia dinghuensis]|uniref:hypothetical protein n=1 Tax=Aliidongia dinghuensis TaxID=1867774 RepID=UPI00166CB313|nr:hypothetical protein [Aliidongia dinghuensis]
MVEQGSAMHGLRHVGKDKNWLAAHQRRANMIEDRRGIRESMRRMSATEDPDL